MRFWFEWTKKMRFSWLSIFRSVIRFSSTFFYRKEKRSGRKSNLFEIKKERASLDSWKKSFVFEGDVMASSVDSTQKMMCPVMTFTWILYSSPSSSQEKYDSASSSSFFHYSFVMLMVSRVRKVWQMWWWVELRDRLDFDDNDGDKAV